MLAKVKTCSKCAQEKSVQEFYVDRTYGGYSSRCKACSNAASRTWYTNNPERRREYADKNRQHLSQSRKEWRNNNRERSLEMERSYKANNREKVTCRNRFNDAVGAGILVRPNVCSQCAKVGFIEGHHHDYSKPLEVEWLCKECHSERHRNPWCNKVEE